VIFDYLVLGMGGEEVLGWNIWMAEVEGYAAMARLSHPTQDR
jgi:hypothetical protein